jgi:hypothetical protein
MLLTRRETAHRARQRNKCDNEGLTSDWHEYVVQFKGVFEWHQETSALACVYSTEKSVKDG